MAALDVKGSGAERAPGSEKQGMGEEDDGRNSYKKKVTTREVAKGGVERSVHVTQRTARP